MTDLSYFHCVDDLVCQGEHRAVAKAGGYLTAAVYTGKYSVFLIAAQLQGFLDHRGEVLALPDMYHTRVGYYFGGEYPVCVAWFYRHQAVGGKKDRRREIGKFLLLVLPGRAVVAFQVRIFFQ